MAEAVARCQSYLARLGGQVPDKVALLLTEKAQASLDNAAANAKDSKKTEIMGLQKIIGGMKEARSIGLLANEPLMQSRALTNASEYLIGEAQGWASVGVGGFLCQALKNINASIEVQISGRSPADTLQVAATALRQASAAENAGKEKSANMIAEAAEILEGSAANVNGQCQTALLLIAEAMASNSLSEIDDSNSIITWDDFLQTEPTPKPITKKDLPVLEISKEKFKARDLILADCRLASIKADVTCKSFSQLFLHKDGNNEPIETLGDQDYDLDHDEPPHEARIRDIGPKFSEAPLDPEIEKRTQKSPFSRSNAVVLLNVLTALLVILLAIEAILYLI